jgi:hypothetical protein
MRNLTDLWNDRVNAGMVGEVCALYAKSARLMATFAGKPIDDPEGIRAYFDGFTNRVGAGVSFEEKGTLRQDLGNQQFLYTGTYTFFHGEAEARQEFPARYTFLVDESSDPKILHHHSSVIPQS